MVESVNPPQWPGLILRLAQPATALAHLFALPVGGPVMLPVRLYLYGEEAIARAEEIAVTWQRWLDDRFPPRSPPG